MATRTVYVQVQVRVQVLQNCTRVQVPSTASEAITIPSTKFIDNLLNDDIFTVLYFSVMTFNMCFNCVLILVFFRPPPPKKMTMAQLRHLEIGIDATVHSN